MLPLIILTGPTTSGKSETALALARKLDTEIISADSLQVYKYFDIGTAKPSLSAREEIPHHLIDILDPDEEFNAFDFKLRALKIISELMDRDKIPILVGGTGLYIKVLTEDYDCAEGGSPEIREKIQEKTNETCHQITHKRKYTFPENWVHGPFAFSSYFESFRNTFAIRGVSSP